MPARFARAEANIPEEMCCEVRDAATHGTGRLSCALATALLVFATGVCHAHRMRAAMGIRKKPHRKQSSPVTTGDEYAVRSHMILWADRQISAGVNGRSTHAGSSEHVFGHLAGGDGAAPSARLPRRLPALCRRVHGCSALWRLGGRQRSQQRQQHQRQHAVHSGDGGTMLRSRLCGACRWAVPC